MNAPPTIDPTAKASSNDGSTSMFIDEFGPYHAKILRSEYVVAETGTSGIMLQFKTQEGRVSPTIKLWLWRADGSELPGWGIMGALKVLAGINEPLQPVEAMVKRYDPIAQKTQEQPGWVYPQLQGALVGFYLKHELWENKRLGKMERKLAIQTVFHITSNQTYNEFTNNKPAKKIREIWDRESANPVPDPDTFPGNNSQEARPAAAQPPAAQPPTATAPGEFGAGPKPPEAPGAAPLPDFDDDIPF